MAKAEPGAAFPPIAEVLPHRPPLLFLDAMEACEGHDVTCSVVLRADMPHVSAKGAPGGLCIEIFAQAAGCLFGYRAWLEGKVFEGGALVGLRKVSVEAPVLPIGVPLTARAKERWTIDSLSHLDCSLFAGDEALASGELIVAVGRFEEYVG